MTSNKKTIIISASFLMVSFISLFIYNLNSEKTYIDPEPISAALNQNHHNSTVPYIVNRSAVTIKGFKRASPPVFPEWTEVYLGTGRTIYTVSGLIDLDKERETGKKGILIFKDFYKLPPAQRNRSEFKKLMVKHEWSSDVADTHEWMDFNNINPTTILKDDVSWIKSKNNISRYSAERKLEKAMLDVGLAGIDLPLKITENPRMISGVADAIVDMNETMKKTTGLDGAVLGLNGRIFFKWGYKGQIGYFRKRSDGIFEIYVDPDRYPHEWMHAYQLLLEDGLSEEEKSLMDRMQVDWSDRIGFKKRSALYTAWADLVSSSLEVKNHQQLSYEIEQLKINKTHKTLNQAKLSCWQCAVLKASSSPAAKSGLVQRRLTLAKAAADLNESDKSISYIVSSREMTAEMVRDLAAVKSTTPAIRKTHNESIMFNMTDAELHYFSKDLKVFFNKTSPFILDHEAAAYRNALASKGLD